MKLKIVEGDLFEYCENLAYEITEKPKIAFAHVCNCQGVMGAGIAKIVKTKYPSVYNAYKLHEKHNDGVKHGCISYSEIRPGLLGINLHAQKNYGWDPNKQYLSYDALMTCLEQARELMKEKSIYILGIPYTMGCGLSGGDWNVVSAIIEQVFQHEKDIWIFAAKI